MEGGLMDEEERAALKLTRQDLEAMLNASEPADVARSTLPPREAEFLALHSPAPDLDAVFRSKNEGSRRMKVGEVRRSETDLVSHGAD
jgi:hypothetical protein